MEDKWCGPARWKWRPPQCGFSQVCRLHDIDYSLPAYVSRWEADKLFLKRMLNSAFDRGYFKFPFLAVVAVFFYLLARIFGGKYFDKTHVGR